MAEPLRVVVAVDFSESSQVALTEAFEEALRRMPHHPEINAVVVVEDHVSGLPLRRSAAALEEIVGSVRGDLEHLCQAIRRRVQELHRGMPEVPVIIHVRVGETVDQIVGLATELAADLILIGTHGRRGVSRAVLGSVAERVVRTAPCPVLVCRQLDWKAFTAVPRPEPASAMPSAPPGPADSAPGPHRYGYSGPLDQRSPLNHML